MSPERVLIHGTGLIGASLGMALGDAGWHVTGWDPNPDALRSALESGALTARVGGPDEDLDTDFVILAGPPSAIIRGVATLRTTAVVTDVAGVKADVVSAASAKIRFVGGHPMAGRETSGPEGASAEIFRDAVWVLTTDRTAAGDLEAVEQLVRSVGAHPVRMRAADHDRAVARISHLPQILATAIVRLAASSPEAGRLVAGSFRDLTRVTSSEPAIWTELLVANRDHLTEVLTEMSSMIREWQDLLESEDAVTIERTLRNAADDRAGLLEHRTDPPS